MTTSILSAILFGILCWALPTENGLAIFKPPDPQSLANSSGDDDDGESSGSSGYQSSDSDATSSGISDGGRGSDAHSYCAQSAQSFACATLSFRSRSRSR